MILGAFGLATNQDVNNNILIGKYLEKNKKIFKILMGIISIFEGILFVRGLFVFSMSSYKHYTYLFSYILLLVVALSMLFYLSTSDLSKNEYKTSNFIIRLTSCAFIIWSLIISFLDMKAGNFPVVYLTVIVTIASVVLLRPKFFIAMILVSFALLIGADGISGFNYFISSSEVINFVVFLSMVFIINGRLYYSSVKDFKANEILTASVLKERNRVSAISLQTIKSIINTVDAKDKYTREHSQRVAEYSAIIAKKMDWSEEQINKLHEIALLHDIGKIGVPDSILNCTGRLSDEEFDQMRQHTVIGGEILQDLTILPHVDLGAKYHHERYDGTGYPSKLKGKDIPIEARIIAVADSFDAMNSNRVYRKRLTNEIIISELAEGKGKQFDPDLIDIFLPEARRILTGDGPNATLC